MTRTSPFPTLIPGLRSPYEKVSGLVYFARMLDKIRLDHKGKLPKEWREPRGSATAFDGFCCRFLGVNYVDLEKETLSGKTDEEIWDWVLAHGQTRNEQEIEIWNAYMMKRGWRDKYTERLHFRLQEVGLPLDTVQTMFDFIDLDEGRPVRITGP